MLEDARGVGKGGGLDAAGRVPECATATHMHTRGCRNFKGTGEGGGGGACTRKHLQRISSERMCT